MRNEPTPGYEKSTLFHADNELSLTVERSCLVILGDKNLRRQEKNTQIKQYKR